MSCLEKRKRNTLNNKQHKTYIKMYFTTIIKHFKHPLNLDIYPQSEVFWIEDAPQHLKATNSSAI